MNEDALKVMGRKYGYGGKEAYVDCPACGKRVSLFDLSDHVCPEPCQERKPGETPTETPDWWPDGQPAQVLDDKHIYRGKYGQWHHADGRIVNRAERRRAGLRQERS